LFGSYTISCIRSEIFSFKAIKHGLFLRIFRVLHTVQSSVFKVLCVVFFLNGNLLSLSHRLWLVNTFFIFFFIAHRWVLKETLPPFSAASYIIPRQTTNVNNYFTFFIHKFYLYMNDSNFIINMNFISEFRPFSFDYVIQPKMETAVFISFI